MEYKIIIPGKPIAKKRPRFARRGKFVVTYSDQETEEGKAMYHLQRQWKEAPIIGPIALDLSFELPIPESSSKKKKGAMNTGEIKPIKKPDLDNLIKFIKDCANEIVWRDDSQIVKIEAEKIYSEDPKTIVLIRRV